MRIFLLMLLFLASCWARAEVTVESANGGHLQVQAHYDTPATPDLVRQVLTDYDHLADFIPDMHSSRTISAPGQPLQVEQKGSASFLFFSFPLEVMFEIDDDAAAELHFHSVAGNLRDMTGSYRLEPLPSGTRIHYQARFRPDFPVPPLISRSIMRREIERQFDGLLREIERRRLVLHPTTLEFAE